MIKYNYNLDTNNLIVGKTYKSYKELCSVLKESIRAGCSKQQQIRNWSRFFRWERNNFKYTIKEIYDTPFPYERKRTKKGVKHLKEEEAQYTSNVLNFKNKFPQYQMIDINKDHHHYESINHPRPIASNNPIYYEWYKVYAHICEVQGESYGKIYIGVTSSKYLRIRWGKKGEGYVLQSSFYRSIEKCGWDNFSHMLILQTPDKEDALKCEKNLIQTLQTFDAQCGFNLKEDNNGYKTHWLREKDNSRKRATKKVPQYFAHLSHSSTEYFVGQYDLKGELIHIYTNGNEASRETNVPLLSIVNCCKGKTQTGKGYQWRYLDKRKILDSFKDSVSSYDFLLK